MNNVLFDSNILIYAHDLSSPFYDKSTQSIKNSIEHEHVFFSMQNYIEAYRIWSQKLSKPITGSQAWQIIHYYLKHPAVTTIYTNSKILDTLYELSQKYVISGVHIFDAQLVATMLVHKITLLYTANTKDFELYDEIETINPLK